MKRWSCAAIAAALFAVAGGIAGANEKAEQLGGSCGIQGPVRSDRVSLWLRYERVTATEHSNYSNENDVPVASLRGFSSADLDNRSEHRFTVSSDAGDIVCTALGGHGELSGTFDFVPSARFADELRRRGMSAPSSEDQLRLALAHFKLSTLDALLRSGFERPSTAELVGLTDHGVTDDYIIGMQQLRRVPKNIDGLVRMHDHGVELDYARTMLQIYPGSSVEDLIRARDHGVSTAYTLQLSQMGYKPSISDVVRLVDHGVTAAYIERLRKHGYTHLSVDDLIRLRDSGV